MNRVTIDLRDENVLLEKQVRDLDRWPIEPKINRLQGTAYWAKFRVIQMTSFHFNISIYRAE